MFNFIKNFWKKQKIKIILSLIIAIFTGIIGLGFFYFQQKLKSSIEEKNRLNEIVLKKTIWYRDKYNKLVTETTEQRTTLQEYEEMIKNGDEEKLILKNQIEAMGIKLNKVETMGNYGINIFYDTIPIFTTKLDSVTEIENYKDNYISLIRIKNILIDTAYYSINIQDTLIWSIDQYFKEKWKFINIFKARDKYYKLNAKLMNPNAKINFQQFYKFPKKRKKDRR